MRGLKRFKTALGKTFGNKYGNTKTKCLNGHTHDSKMEAQYCLRLLAMKQAKEIIAYNSQVTFPLEVNGVLICNHRVDFLVVNRNNDTEVHEVKGFETPDWLIKKKLFTVLKPHIKYVVIKK